MYRQIWVLVIAVFLPAAAMLQSGCRKDTSPSSTTAFHYDAAEFPGAKPWTSENFKNNPDHFQFAILGDRGAGPVPWEPTNAQSIS